MCDWFSRAFTKFLAKGLFTQGATLQIDHIQFSLGCPLANACLCISMSDYVVSFCLFVAGDYSDHGGQLYTVALLVCCL